MSLANTGPLHRSRGLTHSAPGILALRSNRVKLASAVQPLVVSNSCRLQRSTLAPTQPLTRGSLVIARATGHNAPYPFNEHNYLRVVPLERVPYGPMKLLYNTDDEGNRTKSGLIVLRHEAEQEVDIGTRVLEIFVAGDSFYNVYGLLHNQKAQHRTVHDLLYNTGCPFYVARKVWAQAAVPIRESQAHLIVQHEEAVAAAQQEQRQQQQHQVRSQQQAAPQEQQLQHPQERKGAPNGTAGSPLSTSAARSEAGQASSQQDLSAGASSSLLGYTSIKPDDPDVIKLLKRELEVAVQEEDYAAAIRLRDHPYMLLYRRIEACQDVGLAEEAGGLQRKLESLIQSSSDAVENR